jgi:hypothetical protein
MIASVSITPGKPKAGEANPDDGGEEEDQVPLEGLVWPAA